MSTRGRSVPSFSRGGRDEGLPNTMQYHPSAHPEHQYEGMLRGLGVTSKENICAKRSTSLKRLHDATHFAIGNKKWDEAGARSKSQSHMVHTDPQVVYGMRDAPDKNSSIVDMRQTEHDPIKHYRTEQRERFPDPGPQPLDLPFGDQCSIHLGDDKPDKITQTHVAHFRPPDAEEQRAASLRAAGAGTLIPTSVWPKPPRAHPVTAGPRSMDAYDLGVAAGVKFGRRNGNYSNIVYDQNVRDPIHGVHMPMHMMAPADPGARTTVDMIAEANTRVPPLRSLGCLRPPENGHA